MADQGGTPVHAMGRAQKGFLAGSILLSIAIAVLLIKYVTTDPTVNQAMTSRRSAPLDMKAATEKSKKMANQLAAWCIGVSVGLSVVIVAYVYGKGLKLEPVSKPLVGLVSLGLLCAAFLPQLVSNRIHRAAGTNSIMAVFLLMVVVGVMLKLTTFRLPYEDALKNMEKTGHVGAVIIVAFLMFTACVPLVAHNVWQWQCWMYDEDIAHNQRAINAYAAPICSVLIAVVIIHVFLPTKYSLFTPWITDKMRKHLE